MSGKKFTFVKPTAPKAAPKREKSTFAPFTKPEVEKIKGDDISEDSIIELLIQQDVTVWVPLLIVAKDNERLRAQKDQVYALEFVNWATKFFDGGYAQAGAQRYCRCAKLHACYWRSLI